MHDELARSRFGRVGSHGATAQVGWSSEMILGTERERMLAGETYNCLDPGLETERRLAKDLLRRYNATDALQA